MKDEITTNAIDAILSNVHDHGEQVEAIFITAMKKYATDNSPPAEEIVGIAKALILQICLFEKAKAEGSISVDEYSISQLQTWSVLQVSNKTWASGINSAVIPHFITAMHNVLQAFHLIDLSRKTSDGVKKDKLLTLAWVSYAKRFDFLPWLAYATLGNPLCMDSVTHLLSSISICGEGRDTFVERFMSE